MKKFDVQIALEGVREARGVWAKAQTKFNSDVTAIMTRLLHEAAHNFMSAEEVAKHSGLTVKRVRTLMREAGLNPRDGKTLLSKKAADALADNAALMGIEPHEMDLMSPLAYLPMGSQMKRDLIDAKAVSQVTDLPDEVSGNLLTDDDWHEYQRLPEQGYSHRVWLERRFAQRLAERTSLFLETDETVSGNPVLDLLAVLRLENSFPTSDAPQEYWDRHELVSDILDRVEQAARG